MAQTKINDRQGDKRNALTIFIVDKTLDGIKIHSKSNIIGLSNANYTNVTFNNVLLSNDAVLSIPGTGQDIQDKVMIHSRLHQSVINLTQMKALLQYMLNMAETIEQKTANVEYELCAPCK